MTASCRLCNGINIERLFSAQNIHGRQRLNEEHFDICSCRSCGAIFTDISISGDYYDRYYPADYYPEQSKKNIFWKLFHFSERIVLRRKLRLISKYKSKGNRILEIGCAQGKFLTQLPVFFEKHGIEINENGYRFIKDNIEDISIYRDDLSVSPFHDKNLIFDVIVLWNVLEHIANPEAFFRNLKPILKKDGAIILTVPNAGGIGFRLAQASWYHLDAPRHLFYYRFEWFKKLLNRHELKIVYCQGEWPEYFQDLPFSILNLFRDSRPLIKYPVLASLFPFFFLLRLLTAVVAPHLAELNTYVIANNETED